MKKTFALLFACAVPYAQAETVAETSPLPAPSGLAPYAVRLHNAETVKVMGSLLGVKLGDTVEAARRKLDPLAEGGQPTKQETEEDEGEGGAYKVLWQMKGGPYSTIFLKTDDSGRVNNMTGFFRAGKELAFDKIGEVKKAPIANAKVVAWDVARPKQPLFRVVAEGADNQARTITIFTVKRPNSGRDGKPN